MALCDVGGVTNWASITKFIVAPEVTVSCHVPYRNFIDNIPVNMTIIFQADPTTILCNHNIKPSIVKARARSAKLVTKTFKLPADK